MNHFVKPVTCNWCSLIIVILRHLYFCFSFNNEINWWKQYKKKTKHEIIKSNNIRIYRYRSFNLILYNLTLSNLCESIYKSDTSSSFNLRYENLKKDEWSISAHWPLDISLKNILNIFYVFYTLETYFILNRIR